MSRIKTSKILPNGLSAVIFHLTELEGRISQGNRLYALRGCGVSCARMEVFEVGNSWGRITP